jgi:hypothetical protein
MKEGWAREGRRTFETVLWRWLREPLELNLLGFAPEVQTSNHILTLLVFICIDDLD